MSTPLPSGRAVLVMAAAILATPLLAQDAPDRLSLATYLDLEDVQSPRIAPDGRQIVFTRRWIDKLNDRWESSLWIMDADGSRARFLVKGADARWSPDGTRIAYLAQGDPSGTQVFVRWMDAEGATSQITRVTESPGEIEWAPDGQSIAFRMLVPARESWRIDVPAAPKGAKWTEAPHVVEQLDWRQDRIGATDVGFRHLFVVPASGGTPRQLTSGNWDHGSPVWTPDGRSLLFSGHRVEGSDWIWRESEIYAVEVSSGTIRQLTTRRGPDGNPTPSPNGQLIAYTGSDSTDATWIDQKLWVMNANGSSPRELAANLDRSPQNLMWAPDGSGVYFLADDAGTRNLWFAPLQGPARQITRGTHMLNISELDRAGATAVGTLTSPHRPNDIVSLNLRRPAEIRQLTSVNQDILAGKRLGEVEELWVTSTDGLRVQGWIIKPPDFDPAKTYPMILTIHGGPHSMYHVGFNFAWQEHAAHGYVVLYTNPRGSTGYGSEFGNAIKNAYPGKDYDDLMAAVDSVVGRGYVDARNLFVYGCSGGGVLTSWIVGHTDRFAAASANCPVTNWLSFVGTTDGPNWYRNFEKLPWDDPTEHLRRSPLMYVGNVKTPTMLMTGVKDLRTPIAQTEEYYQALKFLKVPTAMIRFNEEWHGTTSKPSNFLRTQAYLRHWFQRHGRPVT